MTNRSPALQDTINLVSLAIVIVLTNIVFITLALSYGR